MDIQKITFSNHPMELFRYYYPNSLQGQENGAEKLMDIELDVHTKITRPDGIETCTCGLVYTNDPSGWLGHYGHRNHQTGEPQPVARITDEYVSHKGVRSITTSYRCEYCGTNEIGDRSFFSSKGPGSRRKNIHSCVTDEYDLSKLEFQEARHYFHRHCFFFRPTPNSYYSETLGSVSIIVDSSGARLSGTGSHFSEAMNELLSNRSMLISENQERLLEISKDFSARVVFDPWRVSDNRPNWLYWSSPTYSDGPNGFVKFSNEEVAHLNYEAAWPFGDPNPDFVEETFRFKMVKFQMTKEHFIVYGNNLALPVAQVPVIGLTSSETSYPFAPCTCSLSGSEFMSL